MKSIGELQSNFSNLAVSTSAFKKSSEGDERSSGPIDDRTIETETRIETFEARLKSAKLSCGEDDLSLNSEKFGKYETLGLMGSPASPILLSLRSGNLPEGAEFVSEDAPDPGMDEEPQDDGGVITQT